MMENLKQQKELINEDGSFQPDQVYRMPEVLRLYGVSKPTLYRWIKAKSFPPPVLLGGPGTRAVGWLGSVLAEHQSGLSKKLEAV